ncbi:MAG TPA: cytochrome c oxidase subunit II [Bryobacteraceae bacterium]|nr:cytochrome c oxidase subunit II [Bryobacteraceae bacterium]
MWSNFSFNPVAASTGAVDYDQLWMFEVVIAVIMTVLIFLAVFVFAIKYRRRSPDEPPPKPIYGNLKLEIFWTVTPLLTMLVMFGWGAKLYYEAYTPPKDALQLYVTAKQWMWKVQYPEGQREINEVHVPTGRDVAVTLASEDVLHSFFIPAFRVKHDVVPGSFQHVWFHATKPGRYHLFCAEYCGTDHSGMIGWIDVMTPLDYENWVSGAGEGGGTMAQQGERMFEQMGCSTCHLANGTGRGPSLQNVYGHPVQLDDGRTVLADEAFIREAILYPNAKVVRGYKRDIMPNFQGQISEEGLLQLLVYIKSLSAAPQTPSPAVKPGVKTSLLSYPKAASTALMAPVARKAPQQ